MTIPSATPLVTEMMSQVAAGERVRRIGLACGNSFFLVSGTHPVLQDNGLVAFSEHGSRQEGTTRVTVSPDQITWFSTHV